MCEPPFSYNLSSTKCLKIGLEAIVYGFPHGGGQLSLNHVSAFELDYLGLDRFSECDRPDDRADEDAFCLRLSRLGAWFCRPTLRHQNMDPGPDSLRLWIGWSEADGVWVLKMTTREALKNAVGRVRLAKNMDERCRAIDISGGKFYSDPKDCEDTRDLVG